MKKEYIVKKNYEFQDIIKTGNIIKSKTHFLYYKENNIDKNRVGISVGKKLCNAVYRNLYKRQTRAILNSFFLTLDYQKTYDFVLIIRANFLNTAFLEKQTSVKNSFNKINNNNNKQKG
ncbi:ribonuclease P protein component [Spiroplasma endosymbiont of Anurida maritima]|uniref:ribonuclease P protein component n=1 Tax=Spiroplasma endosymbiont of Anurida maritima TaxID=2967972 RepID=UPI0036D27F9B